MDWQDNDEVLVPEEPEEGPVSKPVPMVAPSTQERITPPVERFELLDGGCEVGAAHVATVRHR